MNRGRINIDLKSKPLEPYPSDNVGTGAQTAKRGLAAIKRAVGFGKRDGESEEKFDVEGRPIPLHIRHDEVVKCLNVLKSFVEQVVARETDMKFVDVQTGRVVAVGELGLKND